MYTIKSDLTPSATLIKESIAKAREQNIARNESNREKIGDFYYGRQYKEEYLTNYGYADSIELPLEHNNITRKIINKCSMVYKNAPDRFLDNGQERPDNKLDPYQEFLREHTKWNIYMKTAERMVNAFHNVLIRPMWAYGKLNYWLEDTWIPHFLDGDPLTPFAYSIPRKVDTYQTDTGMIQDKVWYMYWSDNDYFWHDEAGEIMPDPLYPDMKNPIGALPFVELRKSLAVDDYWPEGCIDLVSANQAINIMLNDLNYACHFQSFDQIVGTGIDENAAGRIKLGTNEMITTDQPDANISLLGFNPKLQEVTEVIKSKMAFIGNTYNVNIDWNVSGSPQSGFALLVRNIDLLEQREDDVELYEAYEREIYDVLQIQSEVFDTGFKLPKREKNLRLVIDFADVAFPINDQEKREADTWDIENNIKTPVDIIQERDPELDEDQALERFQRNKAINEKLTFRQQQIRDEFDKQGVEVIDEPENNNSE